MLKSEVPTLKRDLGKSAKLGVVSAANTDVIETSSKYAFRPFQCSVSMPLKPFDVASLTGWHAKGQAAPWFLLYCHPQDGIQDITWMPRCFPKTSRLVILKQTGDTLPLGVAQWIISVHSGYHDCVESEQLL